MLFDLILATINRREPLRALFSSLVSQTYQDFRIIVVDQNNPGFLDDIIADFSSGPNALKITHLHCSPGLSKARNKGLAHISGDAVAFLDDDATMAPESLHMAVTALRSCDVAIGSCLPPKQSSPGKTGVRQIASIRELFHKAPSVTLFLRHGVTKQVGSFDETLGLGAGTPYGSGEETDYLARAFKSGFNIERHPEIIVYHPELDFSTPGIRTKARSYGRGRNRVICKHRLGTWFLLLNSLHSLAKSVIYLYSPKHSKFWLNMALGRLGL